MTQSQPAPGARRVPSSAAEALEIARGEYAPLWPDGTPAPLHVEEFDLGYLVYATFPPHTDITRPPTTPGGNCIVVNKTNGDVTSLPNRPPADAIEIYRRFYRPGTGQ